MSKVGLRNTIFILIVLGAFVAGTADAQWQLVGRDSVRELTADPDLLAVQSRDGLNPVDGARLDLAQATLEDYALPGWSILHAKDALALRAGLMKSTDVAFVTPVFRDDLGGIMFPVRSIIAVLEKPEAFETIAELLAAEKLGRILQREWQNIHGALLIEPASREGGAVLELAARLSQLDGILFAEPDLCFTGQKAYLPNDPRLVEMWGINLGLQLGPSLSDFDVDAPEAWDLARGDGSVRVAVLDDGVQHDHPDMPFGFLGADTTSEGPGDGSPVNGFDNHGTSVASVIIARMDNAFGIAGLAPDTSLYTVRCYLSTTISDFITMSSWTVAALTYCETEGVRITNNSVVLGAQPATTTLKYDQTAANGMIHYAAAGNAPALGTRYPANLASVHGLIGLSYTGQLAPFSASGPDMDYTGPADQIITCDRSGAEGYLDPQDFVYQQGTSFATACATAIGALVLGVNPALTDADVHQIIASSCRDLGAPGFDSTFANGLMNAYGAVWQAALTRSDPENVIFMQTGTQAAELLAAGVALVGDVNADGVVDFAIGAPGYDGLAGTDCGRIELRSGASGLTLFGVEGSIAGENFGAALVGPGDLDADGIPDIAVGSPNYIVMGLIDAGRVTIISGATGLIIRAFDGAAQDDRFGAALAAMGDLDADGVGDLAIGAPGALVGMTAGTGRVAVISGLTGAVLGGATGDEMSGELEFGFALARTADHDADGKADVMIGAPGSLYGGIQSGAVVVLGSLSSTRIASIPGTSSNDRLGHAVCTWGDQTGDGIEDYVASAPGFAGSVGPDGGAVVVFASQPLTPVLGFIGLNAGDRYGESLCSSIDIDGDLALDLAIGAPGFDGPSLADIGRVEVYSTASARPRYELVGGKAGQRFGAALGALGDLDGDGMGEILVGAPGDGALVAGFSAVLPAANPAARGPLPLSIAAGTLGATGGGPYDVFFANESSGGVDRTVEVGIGEDLNYAMLQPLANPNPANFALYAYLGVPPSYLNYTLPIGIGSVLWLPCTVTPANPIGFLVTNSTYLDPCPQLVGSYPTPWRYTHVGGLPFPLTVTFYGIIEETPATLRVTNALVLKIQ